MKANPLLALGRHNLGGPFFQRVTKGWLAHAGKRGGGGGGPQALPLWSWLAYSLSLGSAATFTRASTAYVADNQGMLWQAAAGWPRFQGARIADPLANGQLVYNSTDVGGVPLDPATINLLMEPAITNIALNSRDTSVTATWVSANLSTNLRNAVGVDGVANSACTLTDSSNSAIGEVRDVITHNVAIGEYVSGQVYIKKQTAPTALAEVYLHAVSSPVAERAQVMVDLATGASATRGGTLGPWSVISAGDWWKVSLTGLPVTVASTSVLITLRPATGTVLGVSSNTAQGSAVFDMVFVTKNVPLAALNGMSPIPTTTVAVTRAVDALSFAGVPTPNETRMVVDGANVDIDNWNGIYPTPSKPDLVNSINVYVPGQRPS